MNGYEDDWREYKRIRNTFLLVFALYVPVCFGVGVLSVKLFHTFAPGFVAAFVWMALFAISGIRVNLWRCPNCGEMVFRNLVVQLRVPSQTLCALRTAEVRRYSSCRCRASFDEVVRQSTQRVTLPPRSSESARLEGHDVRHPQLPRPRFVCIPALCHASADSVA